MSAQTIAETANTLIPGTTVEVWCQFTRSWSPGFEVTDVGPDGYHVRRRSDGSVLPTPFAAGTLRAS